MAFLPSTSVIIMPQYNLRRKTQINSRGLTRLFVNKGLNTAHLKRNLEGSEIVYLTERRSHEMI